MHTVASRAGRWPLALSLAATITLGACADDPVAPKIPSKPNLSASPTGDFIEVTVTSTSGGTEVGSIRWAAGQIKSAGVSTVSRWSARLQALARVRRRRRAG